MTKAEFKKLVENGPVILDGATGTNLQKAGKSAGGSGYDDDRTTVISDRRPDV